MNVLESLATALVHSGLSPAAAHLDGPAAHAETSSLHASARYLVAGLREIGLDATAQAVIVPVRVARSVDIGALSRRLCEEGVFFDEVDHPAVPPDAHRLRIGVMATHTREDLDRALATFRKLSRELSLVREPRRA
jgi:glycine C-acetyltransferase